MLPLKDIIQEYEKVLQTTIPLKWGERAYHPREIMTPYHGPELPGWKAGIALKQGLAEVASSTHSNKEPRK
jgi:hypothetical protein